MTFQKLFLWPLYNSKSIQFIVDFSIILHIQRSIFNKHLYNIFLKSCIKVMKMYDNHGDESGISEMQSKYNSF